MVLRILIVAIQILYFFEILSGVAASGCSQAAAGGAGQALLRACCCRRQSALLHQPRRGRCGRCRHGAPPASWWRAPGCGICGAGHAAHTAPARVARAAPARWFWAAARSPGSPRCRSRLLPAAMPAVGGTVNLRKPCPQPSSLDGGMQQTDSWPMVRQPAV